jgi:hypothetical protein
MQPVLQRWPCLVQALVFVGVGILLLLLIIVLLLVIWLITH